MAGRQIPRKGGRLLDDSYIPAESQFKATPEAALTTFTVKPVVVWLYIIHDLLSEEHPAVRLKEA